MRLRLDVMANISVIISSAAVLLFVASHLNVRPSYSHTSQLKAVKAGDRIPIQLQHDLISQDKTLLMVMSANCSYCIASMPFYRRLASSSSQVRAHLLALTTDPRSVADAFLRAHNLDIRSEVIGTIDQQERLKVPVTPTLLLVNKTGLVERVWFGRLTVEQENEVISVLQGPAD